MRFLHSKFRGPVSQRIYLAHVTIYQPYYSQIVFSHKIALDKIRTYVLS